MVGEREEQNKERMRLYNKQRKKKTVQMNDRSESKNVRREEGEHRLSCTTQR